MREDRNGETGRRFLAQGKEELASGDLLQASEKLWGAAAHAVKAAARRRRWRHGSHRNLVEAVDKLVAETDQPELRTFFGIAQTLHANFYENWLTRPFIEQAASQVEEFVDRVERL